MAFGDHRSWRGSGGRAVFIPSSPPVLASSPGFSEPSRLTHLHRAPSCGFCRCHCRFAQVSLSVSFWGLWVFIWAGGNPAPVSCFQTFTAPRAAWVNLDWGGATSTAGGALEGGVMGSPLL